MEGICPIGEAGSFGCKNGCQKTKCQWARESDQVALGAGSLRGRKCSLWPASCSNDLSRKAIKAVCRGTMVVEAEWERDGKKEWKEQSKVNIDAVVRGLAMVRKMAAFGDLNLLENCVWIGGVGAWESAWVLHCELVNW